MQDLVMIGCWKEEEVRVTSGCWLADYWWPGCPGSIHVESETLDIKQLSRYVVGAGEKTSKSSVKCERTMAVGKSV